LGKAQHIIIEAPHRSGLVLIQEGELDIQGGVEHLQRG